MPLRTPPSAPHGRHGRDCGWLFRETRRGRLFQEWSSELRRPRSRGLLRYGGEGTAVELRADGSRLVTDRAESFVLSNRDFDTLLPQ